MSLEGKVAIVTGASAGIGRAYALALAAQGATVIAVARRLGSQSNAAAESNTLLSLVAASQTLQGRIHAHACDVTIEHDLIALIEQTGTRFGRIDVLVNNAAILDRHAALSISGADWDRYMAMNVRAPYTAIREVVPFMRQQRAGSIINITAGAGNLTPKSNYAGMLPYAVSKAALNRLTYFLADELRPDGIAVNCLSPGVVASESALNADPRVATTGTHKPSTPEVLGPALVYLAAQTAATLTGQILHTDEFGKTWP